MRVSILILIIVGYIFSAETEESKTLYKFLWSKSLKDSHQSYGKIISNPEKYKSAILDRLQYYEDKPDQIPDALIYIATFIRDERYIPYLIKLIENNKYSYDRCIYSCPIIFSLTIYSCFTNYSIPELSNELTPVFDLKSEIVKVNNIKLLNEDASDKIKGPGIDSLLQVYKNLNPLELFDVAGPKNNNEISRLAAAYITKFRLFDSKHLSSLYWLIITEMKDASMEYRSSIYWAIYKTEMSQSKNNPK
jgi:hypothetical protein